MGLRSLTSRSLRVGRLSREDQFQTDEMGADAATFRIRAEAQTMPPAISCRPGHLLPDADDDLCGLVAAALE